MIIRRIILRKNNEIDRTVLEYIEKGCGFQVEFLQELVIGIQKIK